MGAKKENTYENYIYGDSSNSSNAMKMYLKEIEEYKRIEQEDLKAFNNYDSILAELEEWLKEIMKIYEEDVFDIVSNTIYNQCEDTLDKIQELKEKYK